MATAAENVPVDAPAEGGPPEPQLAHATPDQLMRIMGMLRTRIEELEHELQFKTKPKEQDHDMLKPIDIKDIDKPEKYDNQIAKFHIWFEKFRDLLANLHTHWRKLLKAIENRGKSIIKSQPEFFESLDESADGSVKYIKLQAEVYAEQLKSYLGTYTDGELHARVVQTDSSQIVELMREIIHKGRNRNPNRLVDLKAKALAPRRANKASDLNSVLTEWRCTRRQIVEEEHEYELPDEMKQTILMKINPPEFVKEMRAHLNEGRFKNDYYGFEQALFDEIATRRMDDENKKTGNSIGAITTQSSEQRDHKDQKEEFEELEVWSEERQCYICGIARRECSRSRGWETEDEPEDGGDDRPTKTRREIVESKA